ncbi:sugar-binding transcriptional regulator [Martelella sp. AMO21009]
MQRHQHPSNKIIAEVAWMYYVRNLNQGEIAEALSLSRPTVISYLKLAKERNIVCIQVAPEHYRMNQTADALKEKYGLKTVHVVPSDGLNGETLTRAVCEVAAYHLPNFLTEGDVLGVSWGQTVHFVSELVPNWPIANVTVRQLLGSLANPLLSTSESCSTEIARRLDAECITFNAPAVVSSVGLAAALREEPIIREQLEGLHKCNKSLFSLSPCTPDTHVVQFKIATVDEVEDYRLRGAVGIIAGRFIDADGQAVLGELDERLIGADHSLLRHMEGLLVVSGSFKRDATRAALRGGFADHLVTDMELAKLLLAEETP